MVFCHEYVWARINDYTHDKNAHRRFHTSAEDYKRMVSAEKRRTPLVVIALVIAVIYTIICIAYITNATSIGVLIAVLMLSAIVILIAYLCGRYLVQGTID